MLSLPVFCSRHVCFFVAVMAVSWVQFVFVLDLDIFLRTACSRALTRRSVQDCTCQQQGGGRGRGGVMCQFFVPYELRKCWGPVGYVSILNASDVMMDHVPSSTTVLFGLQHGRNSLEYESETHLKLGAKVLGLMKLRSASRATLYPT